MRNTRNMSNIHYSNEEKKAARRAYLHIANKSLVNIRLSASQSETLQQVMRAAGWTNMSAYIRYRLFGFDLDRKLDELIKTKDPNIIIILLLNHLKSLITRFEYVRFCYDLEMNHLYQKEGVDVNEWARVAKKWLSTLNVSVSKTNAFFKIIALQFGLDSFSRISESDSPEVNLDDASKDELDAMAAELLIDDTYNY